MQARTLRSARGMTMIELMLVVVVVAIIALIAVPMYIGNATAARMSEAVTGAGIVRSAARVWLGTHGGVFGAVTPTMEDMGIDTTDLGGKYVSPGDYVFTPVAGTANFKVRYNPSASMPGGKPYEIDQAGNETTGDAYWTTGN